MNKMARLVKLDGNITKTHNFFHSTISEQLNTILIFVIVPKVKKIQTTNTPQICKQRRIFYNPSRSIRKIVSDPNVCTVNVHHIVKNELGFNSYKLQNEHYLINKIRTDRLIRNRNLLPCVG